MSTYITAALATALGRIAAAHPDAGLQITYHHEDMPENIWHVTINGPSPRTTYICNDETGEVYHPPLPPAPPTDEVKAALCAIRSECTSGYVEMAEVDAQWLRLFGDSADAPWKAVLR